jgi:uncharacterized protein (TIGR02757 family)
MKKASKSEEEALYSVSKLDEVQRLQLGQLLEEAYERYHQPAFIEDDPIQVPHLFTEKGDIEIAGLLTATIAWGNRKQIITHAKGMMERMDYAPYAFICSATAQDLSVLDTFVHRTFNGQDLRAFVLLLQHIYKECGGLESVFSQPVKAEDDTIAAGLRHFRQIAVHYWGEGARPLKHVSDIGRGSAAKRLNMYLRWMVRQDDAGIDFGLWSGIVASQLVCPLDVHSGRIARMLGLLERSADDWQSALELTRALRTWDAVDPIRMDIALFGIGVYEKNGYAGRQSYS